MKYTHTFPRLHPGVPLRFMATLLVLVATTPARAEGEPAPPRPAAAQTSASAPTPGVAATHPAPTAPVIEAGPLDLEAQVREAMKNGKVGKKRLNLILDGKSSTGTAGPGAPPPMNPVDGENAPRALSTPPAVAGRGMPEPGLLLRPRMPVATAAAHKEVAWSYEGEGGTEHWAALRPDYAICGKGLRQSPIALDDSETLQGPAEPIDFHDRASLGNVTLTGHSLEVAVYGDNQITVRGTTYSLVQIQFHHPSEERVNGQTYPMSAHLVHRSEAGQLAIVAVLLEVGEANPLIDRIWTYVPLDVNDTVRTPSDGIHVAEILPRDQRYYQFLGSLTTPPCTEGVLWMVMKQPMTLSQAQLQLFTQLFPNNARPIQPRHDRPVRNAVSLSGTAAP